MALRIELKQEIIEAALDMKIASMKRAMTNGPNLNDLIREIYRKDIAEIERAKNTISEIK